jgi:hypothetical protein
MLSPAAVFRWISFSPMHPTRATDLRDRRGWNTSHASPANRQFGKAASHGPIRVPGGQLPKLGRKRTCCIDDQAPMVSVSKVWYDNDEEAR